MGMFAFHFVRGPKVDEGPPQSSGLQALRLECRGAPLACKLFDGHRTVPAMLNLYRATPFQIKPSTPSSIIRHEIPSQDGSHRRLRFPSSPGPSGDQTRLAKDEKSFGEQYLATQSSIYFRRTKTYPRSILWKVINEDKSLEIRCADLARAEHDQKEAHLTLSFEFQDSITPGGVALADADNADVLWVFVITSSRELHTLSLPTDVFRNSKALAGDIRQWCRTVVPSSFVIDQPHRLYANTPFELFISFDSGRLQRLTRAAEGKDWMQNNYDDRTWTASIRGMVSRRGIKTMQLGSRVLDPSTAQAIVASPDSTYVYTVCLNHTLRVWNLTTGKLVLSKDLLNKPRQPQDLAQLNPAEPAFIHLFQTGLMDHSILVTFSPLDGGQFKFWDIRGGLTDPLSVEDKFPNVKLSPPDPDPSGNTIWSLTGFDIKPGNNQKPTELWVLWRNNNHYRLYTVHFDLHLLPEAWETNWVQTAVDAQNKPSPPDLVKSDPCDSTEKWVEYLFWPGRYPAEVLETSLSIYQDATSSKPITPQKSKSLQERLCSTVSAAVMLRKYADSDMDYERFTSDTDSQWRNFWRIVETISEAQQAPLALAVDTYTDLPWITMAGQCCAIRECSKLELLAHNHPERVGRLDALTQGRWPHRRVSIEAGESFEGMCALIKTATAFQAHFSPELSKDIRVALDEEMLQEAEVPVPSRIIDFYERCNFTDAVSNESYDELLAALEHIGGTAGLSNELFFALIDTLPEQARHPKSALRSTSFGSNVLVSGLQDILMLGRQLTLSLLVLVVFLECEFNQEERQMPEFGAPELFSRLLDLLKEYEKNVWLISHVRLAPLEILGPEAASDTARIGVNVAPDDSAVVTILYDTLGKDIRPQPAIEKPQTFLLTETLEEVVSHLGGSDDMSPVDGLVYIQCNLLLHQNIDLATDFLRFQPKTAWATYIRGRLHIARSEHDQAAVCFRKAAYSLGKESAPILFLSSLANPTTASGTPPGPLHEMSAGLLSRMDADSFYNGIPRYFQHVLALFETAKAFTYAADFAHLALQALQPGQKEPTFEFKSEILSRLFTAELKCSRFLAAFTALAQFTDHALQKSAMVTLVDAILSPTSSITGLAGGLQVIGRLPIGLYPQLSRHVDQHLANLAKKQRSIPGLQSQLWTSDGEVDHLRVWYAFRIAQKDYRGAVAVLLHRLRLVKKSSQARNDPEATQIRQALLALINALSCVAPEEAYLLTDVEESPQTNGDIATSFGDTADHKGSSMRHKRIIITLDDLRREYQQLLDKCSRIERGDFDFEMGEQGSDDDEEDSQGANGTHNGEAMET